jgi:hypothetical protein
VGGCNVNLSNLALGNSDEAPRSYGSKVIFKVTKLDGNIGVFIAPDLSTTLVRGASKKASSIKVNIVYVNSATASSSGIGEKDPSQ